MIVRALVAVFLVSSLPIRAAHAQPQIGLSSTVVPAGERVTVTVTGTPGEFYAVLGSGVNAGFSYAGVALAVGNDVVILAQGVIGASGEVSIDITPPFNGTVFDRPGHTRNWKPAKLRRAGSRP